MTHSILGGLNEYVEECCTTEKIKPHTKLFFENYKYRCAFQRYLNHYKVSCYQCHMRCMMMTNVSCYKNYRATGNTIPTLIRLLVEPGMKDISRGDRMTNDYYGMDFAWTSGIRVSRPNNINLKMVRCLSQ